MSKMSMIDFDIREAVAAGIEYYYGVFRHVHTSQHFGKILLPSTSLRDVVKAFGEFNLGGNARFYFDTLSDEDLDRYIREVEEGL